MRIWQAMLSGCSRRRFTAWTSRRIESRVGEDGCGVQGGTAPSRGIWQLPVVVAGESLILEQWPEVNSAALLLTASVSIEEGRTVRTIAQATDDDGVLSYQWFFGDLTFASGPEHLHVYHAPGSYELVAHVTDATGNTTCKVIEVTVL